jgi:hypothetical protein
MTKQLPYSRLLIIFTLLMTIFISGCSNPNLTPLDEIRTDSHIVQISMQPDPPKLNGNNIFIRISDSKGKSIEANLKADIKLSFSMPAMASMAAMGGKSTITDLGNGLYKAEFDLPFEGPWTIDLEIKAGQETIRRSYSLTAGRKGLIKLSSGTPDQSTSSMLEPTEKGVITVSEARRQLIGVRIGTVEKRPMILTIRAFGNVTYDERQLNDVVLRVKGWIQHLDANFTGKWVKAGETLFTLYSPDLYATQQEYLLALQSKNPTLQTTIAQRLRLWGISDTQIEQIASQRKPFEYMPILTPASGYIVEKNVIEGDQVEAGQKLFRIANLDKVWVEGEIYQFDLPQIRLGDSVKITLPYIPGKTFEGDVSYIYPYLMGDARTGKIRVELPNPNLELLPDMYANMELSINLGEKLQIPESAVIYTGKRRIVFIDLGEGRLRPQLIVVGLRNQGNFEVISGLSEGDRVVISGNFLIASESQIRSALNFWGDDDDTK